MTIATVVYVSYGVKTLDLGWIPDDVAVLIVHNDDKLDRRTISHPGVVHLGSGANIGFGAGVNLAMRHVVSDRVILCNPDTVLVRDHWLALVRATGNEVVTVALRDAEGLPNSVVNSYWTLPAFVASALRLGRFARRDGRTRRIVNLALGSWGQAHQESVGVGGGVWPLHERWGSGAVLSLPVDAIRAIDGFDEGYFLYYEDADLQQRMAAHNPDLRIRLAAVSPAEHAVGGTATPAIRREIERTRRRSAARYASRQASRSWHIAGRLIERTAR